MIARLIYRLIIYIHICKYLSTFITPISNNLRQISIYSIKLQPKLFTPLYRLYEPIIYSTSPKDYLVSLSSLFNQAVNKSHIRSSNLRELTHT